MLKTPRTGTRVTRQSKQTKVDNTVQLTNNNDCVPYTASAGDRKTAGGGCEGDRLSEDGPQATPCTQEVTQQSLLFMIHVH